MVGWSHSIIMTGASFGNFQAAGLNLVVCVIVEICTIHGIPSGCSWHTHQIQILDECRFQHLYEK